MLMTLLPCRAEQARFRESRHPERWPIDPISGFQSSREKG